MAIATVNPATGETLKTFDALSAGEIEERLARAERAFRAYSRTDFAQRAGLHAPGRRPAGGGPGRRSRAP